MTLGEKTIATGANRKAFVMSQLKSILGEDEFAKKEPFINLAIETIIMISYSEIDIKKINRRSLCCK